jgi:hypothetical protein
MDGREGDMDGGGPTFHVPWVCVYQARVCSPVFPWEMSVVQKAWLWKQRCVSSQLSPLCSS